MKAVATRDEVAEKLDLLAVAPESYMRRRRIDIMQRDRLDLKEDLAGRSHSRLDQILDDFLLAIDRDRSPAGELGQVYSMPGAAKAQLDAVMKESFPAQPLTDTGCNQQIDTSLLQHAGSNALLD